MPLPETLRSAEEVHAEYTRRLDARRADLERCARQDYVIGNWRLVVFGGGALMAWAAWNAVFSAWWLLAPVAAFLALVVRHDRVIQRRKRAERAVAFYESGLHRLEDTWAGTGVFGSRFADPAHPYAEDLDLFGRGSLFELLCTARTQVGENCLADWLRAPAPPAVLHARQEAVAELRPRLDLREEIALLGEEIRSALQPAALTAWAAEPARLPAPSVRLIAAVLGAASLGALGFWIARGNFLPLIAMAALGQLFAGFQRRWIKPVLRHLDKPGQHLALLSALLARIEAEEFQAPLLQQTRAALNTESVPASARIARLQTWLSYLESQRNQLLAPLCALVLWTTQCAYAIERWRIENGPHLAHWLQALGEFEALCALAGYAGEHPDYPFPEIVSEGVCFRAEGLAHPLLPHAHAVGNDIALDAEARLFIVSGSNMSGKSTLLRTLGTNAALALAGAPVRARRLTLTPFQIGASIRTQDSLQAGISRFYAEITRLRQIVDLAGGQPPLLFLLDEILHGTNSHDRRIGAEAVVRALLQRHAVGLITTHDLALAQIANEPGLAAVNVHFEDHLEDGTLRFDYRLRSGVVQKSNALELMRAVGLEV